MLDLLFKEKCPFCYNYFSELLSENFKSRFPQSIVFEGSDTKLQFLFALELARILNSDTINSSVNEKWIKNYSHPAVNIVSQIHFKPEDDKTKNVISVKQAKAIENSLKTTSDYYRFFIFFSSEIYYYHDEELENFKKLGYSTDIDFSIEPLKYNTFSEEAINSLLKSIEEPPKNTCFIFLTKSREDILPTISSRSQIFKLSSNDNTLNFDDISELIPYYPIVNYENAYNFIDKLIQVETDNERTIEYILNKFNSYLGTLIVQNPDLYSSILNHIKIINTALKMYKANIHENNILETMALRLVRGY